MLGPRFSTGRLMLVIAAVAGLLAVWRTHLLLAALLAWLLYSVVVGGVGWWAYRRWPRRTAVLIAVTHLFILPLTLVMAYFWGGFVWGVILFWLFGCEPFVLGCGLAWLTAPIDGHKGRGVNADWLTMLTIVIPSFLILVFDLIVLIVVYFLTISFW